MFCFINAKDRSRCLYFDFTAASQPFTQRLNIDEAESDNRKTDQHTIKNLLVPERSEVLPAFGS